MNLHRTRPAAVAGRFYPAGPLELRGLLEALLLNAPTPQGPAPKALIAPHAGYVYSGPIAASAYASLRPDSEGIKRIVLIGPAHFVAIQGLAASSASAFATPLGTVPVDQAAIEGLLKSGLVRLSDEAHAREHSLEVQLPFLQFVVKEFALVPLVAGEATIEEVKDVLDQLWDGPETRIVISSDLSHYLDSNNARELDRTTALAIEQLRSAGIGERQACGRIPICGLLRSAAEHGLRARTADLRNSGDTAGPRDQVVGYGAFTFARG